MSNQTRDAVLVVEDNEILRMTLAEFLKEDGWHVFEAENGSHALQIMDGHNKRIKAMVFDRWLPMVDGSELFKHCHAEYKDIRYIMLSGSEKDAEINELLTQGLDDFASKPILREQLIRLVQDNTITT